MQAANAAARGSQQVPQLLGSLQAATAASPQPPAGTAAVEGGVGREQGDGSAGTREADGGQAAGVARDEDRPAPAKRRRGGTIRSQSHQAFLHQPALPQQPQQQPAAGSSPPNGDGSAAAAAAAAEGAADQNGCSGAAAAVPEVRRARLPSVQLRR